MHMSLLAFPFLAALCSATRYKKDMSYRAKESIQRPPTGWHALGRASPDHLVELKIFLPQPQYSILEKHLLEVSNPDHERYGAYLSKEETEALMAPHRETLSAVNEWLSGYGIGEKQLSWSPARDKITARIPVGLAEEMLDTRYYVYIHSDSGESLVRTTKYSLPESLHQHVESIQPTTMFTRPRTLRSTLYLPNRAALDSTNPSDGTITGPAGNPVDASCNGNITVSCLKQLYNAAGYNGSATDRNKIAVTAFLHQYANNQDLQQFFQLENPVAYGSNYTFVSVNGGLNNQSYAAAGGEANLDTQFAFGLAFPIPAVLYSTSLNGSVDDSDPVADWLEYVLSQDNLPQTISTSYNENEQDISDSYARHMCAGFAALGARGVSVLFSSGDGGVAGTQHHDTSDTGQCLPSDGTNKTVFIPTYPSTCPYLTSIGGTNNIPEVGSNFSSGGFSNYFPRPDYQNQAVNGYLGGLAPGTYEGLYNPNGRAYPDVAAQASDFLIIYQGQETTAMGTSCAAPTFAALVSMLNDARITAGKPPLGFLNQWLYGKAYAALNDITVGNNPGCGTSGFNATTGWDPVTGLGTPNFQKLLELAMAY